ncbi:MULTISPECIES: aminopeptidase P family protein [Flavobacteriaceae]|uniref:Xaa-Pro aminopeptidase n=2 Tax=Flagellimonas TaxID=444459 RepID=A0ABT5XRQ5_9FLAO|nr:MULTISPECIES: aminopeptidase P family protein [Flavobacteriaceae]MBO0356183.1 aminopeptidase P family protein [Allomuricauda aurea]MDF0708568.1 aminopeptidase P family protein [[Muricauda] okinawensis]
MFFDKETYVNRRSELIKKIGSGIIVLPGNSESARNFKANTYFFVQDSSFLYYMGINLPDLVLVLNCETGESILFGNEVSLEHTIWIGPQEPLRSKAYNVGVYKVLSFDKLSDYIKDYLNITKIHFLPPYRISTTLLLSNLVGLSIREVSVNSSKELIDAVVSQREIKSSEEIDELEQAIGITKEMHVKVISKAKPGLKESDLVGALESSAISAGGRTAYPPIVSIQGQILHNINYTNELRRGQLLLGDFGGLSSSGYAGDITRTIPVSGKFSAKQKEIYQIVLDAQKRAIEMLEPNVLYRDVHLAACYKLAEGLKDLGLMKGDVKDAVATGAHALFFPHGLGHMIGLDVHDMESLGENNVGYDTEVLKSEQFGLKSLRLGKRLKEGFTITVEPGIYFIPELFHEWKSNNVECAPFLNFPTIESYLDFGGVRIEDEYVITRSGSNLIGEYIPKEISEIEQIMN